jgi:hypothetical protein
MVANELLRRFHDPNRRIVARFVGIIAMVCFCLLLVIMYPPHLPKNRRFRGIPTDDFHYDY